MKRLFLICLFGTAFVLCAADKPNIIIILADDLGYGDLGCYGHPSIRTPNIDRMAREGLRFTDFYSTAEVCTPSRAALLTGRYPVRSGMCGDKRRVLPTNAERGLPASEITIAEALKTRGYATGCVGKWHLGVKPEYNPRRNGFDFYFGLPHSNDMNSTTNAPRGAPARLDQHPEWWNAPLYRNDEVIEQPADQTTLTKRYTDEATGFIRRNRRSPFFLYFPHTFPHVPLFASERFRGQSSRGLYGDVVEELDWSVGQILETLRKEGLAKNTIVIFTSDNGPWLTQRLAGGSAGLLHEGKGSTWEGGMRVPCVAWWPGRIKAGTVTGALACNMDLFGTALALAGAEFPKDRTVDGLDLTPILSGKSQKVRDVFFYYRGTQLYAARQGDFKAHFITRSAYGRDEFVKHDPPLLFNVRHDPSEQFNAATNNPAVLRQIMAAAEQHRASFTPAKSLLDD
jgi:arylsulfatase A